MSATDSPGTTLRLLIRGRVQGVGFRYALADEARARKLRGWVRNRRDGCVEAIVAGPAADVDAIVAWSRRGPAAAQVTAVDTAAAEGEFAAFEIAPTV
ncbi:MAG: acylphosphatase [Pseudomonadota bacterium]|nr:acylphosphatase [Pseudomonadota bacterium]